jgi:hypothetical protein
MHCCDVRPFVRRGSLCFGWWEPSVIVSARAKLVRRVISNTVNAEGLLDDVPAGKNTPKPRDQLPQCAASAEMSGV